MLRNFETFFNRNLFACLQGVISSFRFLREAKFDTSANYKILFLQLKDKVHQFEAGLQGETLFKTSRLF